MLIYISQGQLGNQIFQYSFLINYKNDNEYILSIGFDNLIDVFIVDKKIFNIPKNKVTRYLKVASYIFEILAKLRIVTYIGPAQKRINEYFKEDVQIINRMGLLRWSSTKSAFGRCSRTAAM